jgi:hypothetical protein
MLWPDLGDDNPYRLDDEERHADALLTFTREMTDDGPVIQHD